MAPKPRTTKNGKSNSSKKERKRMIAQELNKLRDQQCTLADAVTNLNMKLGDIVQNQTQRCRHNRVTDSETDCTDRQTKQIRRDRRSAESKYRRRETLKQRAVERVSRENIARRVDSIQSVQSDTEIIQPVRVSNNKAVTFHKSDSEMVTKGRHHANRGPVEICLSLHGGACQKNGGCGALGCVGYNSGGGCGASGGGCGTWKGATNTTCHTTQGVTNTNTCHTTAPGDASCTTCRDCGRCRRVSATTYHTVSDVMQTAPSTQRGGAMGECSRCRTLSPSLTTLNLCVECNNFLLTETDMKKQTTTDMKLQTPTDLTQSLRSYFNEIDLFRAPSRCLQFMRWILGMLFLYTVFYTFMCWLTDPGGCPGRSWRWWQNLTPALTTRSYRPQPH
eukprot:sb/3465514/